jgi:hypothetical protein
MKLPDIEIKKKLINSLVAGPPLIMLWLLRQIYLDLLPLIPKQWYSSIPQITAIKIIALLSILNLLTIAYCAYLLFFRDNFKKAYGVLWDKNKKPHCPSCKTYLSGYTARVENCQMHFLFWCHKHGKAVYLFDDYGSPISFDEAKKHL